MKRLFVAIPVPDRTKETLLNIQREIKSNSIRWVPVQNLHVTVHFIGSTDERNLEKIVEAIEETASNASLFELNFDSLKVIRKNRKAIMIWARFQANDNFSRLTENLQRKISGEVSKDPIPHITLARFHKKKKAPEDLPLPEMKPFCIKVNEIELWESVLGSGHPEYKFLQRFSLHAV